MATARTTEASASEPLCRTAATPEASSVPKTSKLSKSSIKRGPAEEVSAVLEILRIFAQLSQVENVINNKRMKDRVRFSLPFEENAFTVVVKAWAKGYCENVLGCSTHNPWDADANVEPEVGSDAEDMDEDGSGDLEADYDDETVPRPTTAEDGTTRARSTNVRSKPAPEDLEEHRFLFNGAVPVVFAGFKRRAVSEAVPVDLVERPKKRMR